METRYPKEAVTLVNRVEVIAKPRTFCPPCRHGCDHPCEEYFEYADYIDTNPRPWGPGEF